MLALICVKASALNCKTLDDLMTRQLSYCFIFLSVFFVWFLKFRETQLKNFLNHFKPDLEFEQLNLLQSSALQCFASKKQTV